MKSYLNGVINRFVNCPLPLVLPFLLINGFPESSLKSMNKLIFIKRMSILLEYHCCRFKCCITSNLQKTPRRFLFKYIYISNIKQEVVCQHHSNRTQFEDIYFTRKPVRFIDAFVEALSLQTLGFSVQTIKGEGRPSFDTKIFLKIYLYGISMVCGAQES
jgi:hypothetical protein